MNTAEALMGTLTSENVADANLEPANVVDTLYAISLSGRAIANAILPAGTSPGTDETGGTVDSLTEAVMGLTGAMIQVASAISEVAEAIREKR